MPKIIYKQQHIGDGGRKFSPSRNAHYVKYIGEREHVLKKNTHETNLVKYIGEREHAAKQIDKNVKIENKRLIVRDIESKSNAEYDVEMKAVSEKMQTEPENGLFGYINGKFSDTYSTADMQKYVRSISTPHRNVFHSIFSFTPESAEQAGLNTLDDWENWTKYHISDIANGMNMKIENIEYLAAVHLKEGQPHVHIMWWDKEQQVLINKVDPLVCDKIRIDVIRKTYRNLFSEIHSKENIMRDELRKNIEKFLGEISADMADEYSMNIMARMQNIAELLPKKGRLTYQFVKYKNKKVTIAGTALDNLTHYIIDNNPEFRAKYEEILSQRLMYNQLLHNKTSRYGQFQIDTYVMQCNDVLEKSIGNKILTAIKNAKIAGQMQTAINLPDDDFIPPYDNLIPPPDEEFVLPSDDLVLPPDEEFVSQKKYKIFWSKDFKSARDLAKSGEYKEAIKLFKKEAEKKNVLAIYEIGDLFRRELTGENSNEYFADALNGFLEIEPKTKLKSYVQYRIGRMFYDGYGTEKDCSQAFEWLRKSADNGNHYAEFAVSKMLLRGEGTKKNIGAAIEYLIRAADTVAPANAILGKIYLNESDYKSETDAIFYLEKAMNAGIGDSAYQLYRYWHNKTETENKANEYLEKTIELLEKQNNDFAKLTLGKIYADEHSNVFDFKKAENYLLTAARSNDGKISEMAEYQLGKLYYSHGENEIGNALKWLYRAFLHGNNCAALMATKILCNSETHFYNPNIASEWLNETIRRVDKKNNSENNELISNLNYKLGKIYATETNYNPILAEKHLKSAADFGNAYAMYALARLYVYDENVKKPALAITLLNNAKIAEADIAPYADCLLGQIYLFDKDKYNLSLAKNYLKSAAEAGNIFAQQIIVSQNVRCVSRLLNSVSNLLSEYVESDRAALSECAMKTFGRGDLSKEQIRELILKKQDKENTAEM